MSHGRNRGRDGAGSRHAGAAERAGHEATKLLAFLLLLACLFLLLLHDLRVPLLASGRRKPVISALSLNRSDPLLFHVLLAGELGLVTAGHVDGNGSKKVDFKNSHHKGKNVTAYRDGR